MKVYNAYYVVHAAFLKNENFSNNFFVHRSSEYKWILKILKLYKENLNRKVSFMTQTDCQKASNYIHGYLPKILTDKTYSTAILFKLDKQVIRSTFCDVGIFTNLFYIVRKGKKTCFSHHTRSV